MNPAMSGHATGKGTILEAAYTFNRIATYKI